MARTTTRRVAGALAALFLLAPTTPADAAPRRTVSGWVTYWSAESGLNRLLANADIVRAVSPFWYYADGDTNIVAHTGAGNQRIVDAAHAKHLAVIPTITETMGAAHMSTILGNATRRANHENALVSLVMRHGYDGIDVDYEQFVRNTDPHVAQVNKDGFSAFVKGLCGKLRARSKKCVITVHARTDDAMQASYRPTHSVGVFDYAVIVRNATTMRIMAYGQHYPSGATPGPVAGYPWVKQIADYTAAKAGAWRVRVEIGVAQVGYDWSTAGGRAQTYTFAQAVAKMNAVHAVRRWSDTEQAPYFTYRDSNGYGHRVWYDDARSGAIRARLSLRYGFAGIALWYPGIEDSRIWTPLREASAA